MTSSLLGTTVGNIRIVDHLGKGGSGEVYVGHDEKLGRKVALKAIRPQHRLNREAKARLLREARILSRLEHPHICRVYDFIDAGEVDFLVLELIPGQNLRQALRQGVAPALQMRIAIQIAEVLEAAHGQGVIHRDLKPENVMLTPEGEVKVLDFGLARTLDGEVVPSLEEDQTATLHGSELGAREASVAAARSPVLQTRLGRVIGTVPYMSPEQAEGKPATAASDVYSFGLLLQELFTGKRPYEENLSIPVMLVKAARAETLPVQGVDPDLAALLNRLKSRAPSARPSASETAARLRAVRDKPRRRRQRWLLGAAMAFLAAVALVMSFLAYRISREAERANREAERAERQAAAARQVSDFLVDLFDLLDRTGGDAQRANTITAREILDFGAEKVSRELRDQPLTQARLLNTIGTVYQKLGLYQDAEPLVRRALEIRRQELGPEHVDVAESESDLAYVAWRLGNFEQAIAPYEHAIAVRERELGAAHPDLAESLNGLGIVYWNQGKYDLAEPLYRRALEIRERALGPLHPDVAASLDNLAILYKDQGRETEAEPLYRRALAVREQTLGPASYHVGTSLSNLGELYKQQGRYAEAEPLYRRALAVFEQTQGNDHPAVAVTLNNLADVHAAAGRYPEARELYARALAILERALAPDHPFIAYVGQGLARVHAAEGRPQDAAALLARSLQVFESALGADHPDVGRCLFDLAKVERALGRKAEADAAYRRALDILRRALGDTSPEVAEKVAAWESR